MFFKEYQACFPQQALSFPGDYASFVTPYLLIDMLINSGPSGNVNWAHSWNKDRINRFDYEYELKYFL